MIENIEHYHELTARKDWAGICSLNGVDFDAFGTKKELRVLHNYLEDGEAVLALASGLMTQTRTSNAFDLGLNTWLVALTTERFLCLDCALITGSVDTQSIIIDQVQAVSASQGWMFGKISIDLGSRQITIDNCMKKSVPIFSTLANKLMKARRNHTPDIAAETSSPIEDLERLARMRDRQVLSDAEFEAAKARILARL